MRTVKTLHQAESAPIADLVTYRALPTRSVDYVDPFLFLNHHGLQTYKPNNDGLPFGPHPHRGFETVTFIVAGDIKHKDSGGYESVIDAGGIQWMTAGRGLIHAETSSEKFKKHGGDLEILQLWVNLPARYKMIEPKYIGLQKKDIPTAEIDDGKVKIHAVSGSWKGTMGALQPLADIYLATAELKSGGRVDLEIAPERNIFFYVIRGKVNVNGKLAGVHTLVEFANDDDEINIEALSDAMLLLGHAEPFKEPVVAQGPFVMNTETEISEAYQDYRSGKFGMWEG